MEMTPEMIAQCYSACMDSVNLLNGGKPEYMDEQEWADCVARNKEHLELMLAKDFWATENLKPIKAAIK